MLADGGRILTIWDTVGQSGWNLTFVIFDGRRVAAVDCMGSVHLQTRDQPVIQAAGRELRILGFNPGRPPSPGLAEFAAQIGITITLEP